MTAGRALANLSDCHNHTDIDHVNRLVHECLTLGAKPWHIKKTLRDSLIPVSCLSDTIQKRLA